MALVEVVGQNNIASFERLRQSSKNGHKVMLALAKHQFVVLLLWQNPLKTGAIQWFPAGPEERAAFIGSWGRAHGEKQPIKLFWRLFLKIWNLYKHFKAQNNQSVPHFSDHLQNDWSPCMTFFHFKIMTYLISHQIPVKHIEVCGL